MSDYYSRTAAENEAARAEEKKRTARYIKFGATAVGLVILLTFGSCQTLGRITTIKAGEVGIRIKNSGANAGVQRQELPQGLYIRGLFEDIERYSIRQKVHAFQGDERICFTDKTGLQVCGDVQATVQVNRNRAADIYDTRKLLFEELIDGPIRNDLKSFVAREAEKVPVSCNLNPQASQSGVTPTPAATDAGCAGGSLMGSGRQKVLQDAAVKWSARWAPEGVTISDVQWIGGLSYPRAITDAILARTQIEQETLAAQQQEAKARAQANAQIEAARGVAESTRLRAEALRNSPAVIEEIYAKRSAGICPPTARVCIVGAGAPAIANWNNDKEN